MGEDRAGAGEGPDADTSNDADKVGDTTKTQDAVKGGRDSLDPDADQG